MRGKRRCFDRKRRKTGILPTEKLQEILSQIYTEEVVDELMDRFAKKEQEKKRSENNAE